MQRRNPSPPLIGPILGPDYIRGVLLAVQLPGQHTSPSIPY